jgi:hypothetical protein
VRTQALQLRRRKGGEEVVLRGLDCGSHALVCANWAIYVRDRTDSPGTRH